MELYMYTSEGARVQIQESLAFEVQKKYLKKIYFERFNSISFKFDLAGVNNDFSNYIN